MPQEAAALAEIQQLRALPLLAEVLLHRDHIHLHLAGRQVVQADLQAAAL